MLEDEGAEQLRAPEVGDGGDGGGGLGGEEEEAGELEGVGAGPQDTGSEWGCSHWLTSV